MSELLKVEGLQVYFPIRKGILRQVVGQVKAVDGVNFSLAPGRTLGLVGESGCGKTTIGKAILRLTPATGGRVLFQGQDMLQASPSELLNFRAKAQIVFQDPYSSLNPRLDIGDIIAEGMTIHLKDLTKTQRTARVQELLETVGLPNSASSRYPHEFSGGQRQRIGIARALAVNPQFLVCDEPVSALDLSIQAQVLNLLIDLRERFNLTLLFISHDLSVVRHLCDEVAVMYLGRIVEQAPTEQLYRSPQHPYTQSLLSAIPEATTNPQKDRIRLTGDVPSPINPPSGCPFHPRCFAATELCSQTVPPRVDVDPAHWAVCHYTQPEGVKVSVES
ncbi:ABC transporter ATP-binding protein [Candidatus Cyanaurora vandensis]|uniref:ABC transporter ATP-binding protein n=1 Tax=Candidatus Cyanaurora vandensis TaxID=2714958 RepID=UPI00257AC458|nr:oligopeptide/dipeptide ABC transporter ATP-binding protein [Candidatus Cyanaurora vandensis]